MGRCTIHSLPTYSQHSLSQGFIFLFFPPSFLHLSAEHVFAHIDLLLTSSGWLVSQYYILQVPCLRIPSCNVYANAYTRYSVSVHIHKLAGRVRLYFIILFLIALSRAYKKLNESLARTLTEDKMATDMHFMWEVFVTLFFFKCIFLSLIY